ncbi:MAG: FRG domain-containing protein [Bryobacter sp.]
MQEQLFAESWYPPHGRFRSPFLFRGLPDWRYDRRTTLCRLGGKFALVEDDLLRNFRKYASRMPEAWEQASYDSWWNWLAIGQHYGLPTRLLDWTFSPNVALHFVTASHRFFATDGVVWCINFIGARRYLPPQLISILRKDEAVFFSAEMLDQYARTLEDFDRRVATEGGDCVIFFEPPSLDDRIVNQAAVFSLISSPERQLEEWLAEREQQHPELFRKIIIPAVLKWEVRDKLDNANTTERVIFPGLDGLGKWLRRYYSPNYLIEVDYPGKRFLGRIQKIENLEMSVTLYDGELAVRDVVLTSRPGSLWWDLTGDTAVEVKPRPERFGFIPD